MLPEEVLASYEAVCQSASSFELDSFCGRWYVVQTNLNLWKTRRNPTIRYTRLPGSGPARLYDVVGYTTARGKAERITGIDQQAAANEQLFQWRGDQWYSRWITSGWCVVDHDPRREVKEIA